MRRIAGASLLLGVLLAACGDDGPVADNSVAEPVPRPRNLIVLSIDTLRADHLGCYGYERDTSPAIDAFAERGALFEHAFTTASWTVPAHASLFTGLYARSHGVDNLKKRLAPDASTMAELFGAAGFETAAIVNVYFLGKHGTVARGFETNGQFAPKADERGSANQVFSAAETWIAQREQPFFLFLHCYDVHASYQARGEFAEGLTGPYDGPVDGTGGQLFQYNEGRIPRDWGDADAQRLVDLYDAGIRQFDARLGEFLRFLETEGAAADTLVVLTSDHGEAFLEHGFVMHGRTVHEEELGVPLILVGPGVPAGARVADAVSLVDVLPTVLSSFGLEAPAHVEGLDLGATLRGARLPERALYFETVGGPSDEAPQRALRSGRFKLYRDERTDTVRLFDLDADPGEQRDLADQRPDVLARLAALLSTFEQTRREVEPAGDLSTKEIEALRLLGYL